MPLFTGPHDIEVKSSNPDDAARAILKLLKKRFRQQGLGKEIHRFVVTDPKKKRYYLVHEKKCIRTTKFEESSLDSASVYQLENICYGIGLTVITPDKSAAKTFTWAQAALQKFDENKSLVDLWLSINNNTAIKYLIFGSKHKGFFVKGNTEELIIGSDKLKGKTINIHKRGMFGLETSENDELLKAENKILKKRVKLLEGVIKDLELENENLKGEWDESC